MTKRKQIIFFVSYLISGLLTETFIFYLFPYTGLGAIICYPFSILLSFAFGWSIYKMMKRSISKWALCPLVVLLLTIQIYLQLIIHPQDFGGTPLSQLTSFKNALTRYEEIKYDSFTNLNTAEQVIYYYKFKDRLPKSISILTIDRPNEKSSYVINNYENGRIGYDTDKVNFSCTDTSIVINEKLSAGERISNIPFKTLLQQKGGGYYDRDKETFYNVSEDDFRLKTGIEELFYQYLKWTRKPAGNKQLGSIMAGQKYNRQFARLGGRLKWDKQLQLY